MIRATSLLVGVACAVALSHAPAHAQDLSARGRSTLQSFEAYQRDCTADKKPFTAKTDLSIAKDMVSKCESLIEKQQRRLDKVQGADRNHARYKKAAKHHQLVIRTVKAWRAELEERTKAKRGADQAMRDLKKHVQANADLLRKLYWMKKGESDQVGGNPETWIQWADGLDKLSALAELCAGPAQNVRQRFAADGIYKKDVACDLATHRARYLTQYFEATVNRYTDDRTERIGKEIGDIETDGRTLASIVERLEDPAAFVRGERERYAAVYRKLGKTPPKDLFAGWVRASAGYGSALKTASRRSMLKARAKSGAHKRAAAAAAKSAGFKLVRYGLASKTPRIEKNSIGVPLRKLWDIELLVRADGEKYCRLYRTTAVAQHKGGGRYTAPTTSMPTTWFHISSCR